MEMLSLKHVDTFITSKPKLSTTAVTSDIRYSSGEGKLFSSDWLPSLNHLTNLTTIRSLLLLIEQFVLFSFLGVKRCHLLSQKLDWRASDPFEGFSGGVLVFFSSGIIRHTAPNAQFAITAHYQRATIATSTGWKSLFLLFQSEWQQVAQRVSLSVSDVIGRAIYDW